MHNSIAPLYHCNNTYLTGAATGTKSLELILRKLVFSEWLLMTGTRIAIRASVNKWGILFTGICQADLLYLYIRSIRIAIARFPPHFIGFGLKDRFKKLTTNALFYSLLTMQKKTRMIITNTPATANNGTAVYKVKHAGYTALLPECNISVAKCVDSNESQYVKEGKAFKYINRPLNYKGQLIVYNADVNNENEGKTVLNGKREGSSKSRRCTIFKKSLYIWGIPGIAGLAQGAGSVLYRFIYDDLTIRRSTDCALTKWTNAYNRLIVNQK